MLTICCLNVYQVSTQNWIQAFLIAVTVSLWKPKQSGPPQAYVGQASPMIINKNLKRTLHLHGRKWLAFLSVVFFFFLDTPAKRAEAQEWVRTRTGRQPIKVGKEPAYRERSGVPRVWILNDRRELPLFTSQIRSHFHQLEVQKLQDWVDIQGNIQSFPGVYHL